MAFQNLRDVEELLRAGAPISTRDLYTMWNHRLPVSTAAKKAVTAETGDTSNYIEWLQQDLQTVTAFTEQALLKQEYLLVSDVYDEAKTYWSDESRRNTPGWLQQIAKLTSHCAEAKTRLGFTRPARNILEPLARNPGLGRQGQAKILLQIGDIVREESHHAPDPSSRRATGAQALTIYQEVLNLDGELIDAWVLYAAMQLITSGDESSGLEKAHRSAGLILTQLGQLENENGITFRTSWFRAVALSILGRQDEAIAVYAQLRDIPDATTTGLAEARHRSQFLAEGLGLPRRFYYQAFPPLQLLVFAGHLPDLPGQPTRFPVSKIPEVREVLREKLAQMQARDGIVSAAAGADLLFIEALQQRPGSRYHVVLPWSAEEFFRTSVAPFEPVGAPPIWEPIFRRALENATTVREQGQVYEPSDNVGWEFAQELMAGIALLTARQARLDVQPIAVWDGRAGRGPGGPRSFVELWTQHLKQEPEVIDLVSQEGTHFRTQSARPRAERHSMREEVKSMLFADVVGYSKLTEKVIADFVEVFLQRLSLLLASTPHPPRHVNMWGDAIYAVFDFSHEAGLFALALTQLMRDGEEEWRRKGLTYAECDVETGAMVRRPLNVRIGLHTGPVLAHYNPVLRQLGYTGSHVSRAARIEPIAERGEVYASEEFAAMAELGKEIARRSPEEGRPLQDSIVCEYAGSKALAKGYPGLFRIYRVIPERSLGIEELAKAAHELFCIQLEHEGKTRAEHPSLCPWNELSEDKRDANRAQVADIPNKLFQLGYELTASSGLNPADMKVTAEQLEMLSQREHDRWMADRQRHGWTFGAVRDDARRHHPCVIPWEALPESEKQKDRDTVNNMPLLIGKAGFQIRKLTA